MSESLEGFEATVDRKAKQAAEREGRSLAPVAGSAPSKDWRTSMHDGEVFLNYKGEDVGILWISEAFSPKQLNEMMAKLNASPEPNKGAEA